MTRRRKACDTATQALAMEHLGGTRVIRVRVTEAQLDAQAQGIELARLRDERALAEGLELSASERALVDLARDTTPAGSARYWHQLAIDADNWAAYEEQHVGSGAAHRAKARVYRETAYALALEAVTGKPHCSLCFRDHPNHRHAHRG